MRALTSLGLKEAKDLVDGAPKPVLEKVNKESADKAKAPLEGAGATVTSSSREAALGGPEKGTAQRDPGPRGQSRARVSSRHAPLNDPERT